MKKFSYSKAQQAAPEEDYYAARRKKVNRSRTIYFISLCLITLSALLYLADRIYWVRYDGELTRNLRYVTFPDDIYVLQVNFREGESFSPGDTLFWFCSVNSVNMGAAWGRIDRNNLLDPARAKNNVVQKENELKVLNNRLRELRQKLTMLRRQGFLGVATPQDVRKLESDIENMKVQIELAKVDLETARKYLKTTGDVRLSGRSGGMKIDPMHRYALSDFDIDMEKIKILPWRAKFSGSVFRINVFPPSICYKGNYVLGIQIEDIAEADVHAIMFAQRYKMSQISIGDIVDVKIGRRIHKAKVSFGIPTVREVPSYLEKSFEKEKVALEYRLDFLRPESLEPWEKVNGVPLTIRTKRNMFKYKHLIGEHLDSWKKLK